jgi:hypothetical protein
MSDPVGSNDAPFRASLAHSPSTGRSSGTRRASARAPGAGELGRGRPGVIAGRSRGFLDRGATRPAPSRPIYGRTQGPPPRGVETAMTRAFVRMRRRRFRRGGTGPSIWPSATLKKSDLGRSRLGRALPDSVSPRSVTRRIFDPPRRKTALNSGTPEEAHQPRGKHRRAAPFLARAPPGWDRHELKEWEPMTTRAPSTRCRVLPAGLPMLTTSRPHNAQADPPSFPARLSRRRPTVRTWSPGAPAAPEQLGEEGPQS